MNGFIMADELSIFDLTEADGCDSMRENGDHWSVLKKPGLPALCQPHTHTHTHTHTAVFMQ